MQPLILLLLITDPTSAVPERTGVSYQSKKSLPQLEECLTDRLSKRGDVTAVQAEGYITLVYQDGTHRPMLIDVAPPNVTVTTEFASGTRRIVKSCL